MDQGIVFDIKRFAVHDGPGIRTTVFTKGCPLRCAWCQNPEGMEPEVRLWYFESKCIRCNSCIEACPQKALSEGHEDGPHIRIDYGLCTKCGVCVGICPASALAFDSKKMSAEEVLEEIEKDRLFYDVSGGGVTLSGGDPLYQHKFNLDILKKCRERGIHTAVETCLYANKRIIKTFARVVDLFIVDIKLYHPLIHERYTGYDNAVIKRNFEFLAKIAGSIHVRIPLVPEVTAVEENIRDIARYVRSVREDIPIELINFNPLAANKYRIVDVPYPFARYTNPFDDDTMARFNAIITEEGASVAEGQTG